MAASRDANRVTTLQGVTDDSNLTPTELRVDPTTKRLKVSIAAGSVAPVDATYVTLTTNSGLTNERVLTGTANQITVTDGGAGSTVTLSTPQNIATSSSPTFTGLTLSSMTLGSVLFAGTGGAVTQDNSNFFWDDTNNRLGLGTAVPTARLTISGTGEILNTLNGGTSAQFFRLKNTNADGVLGIESTTPGSIVTSSLANSTVLYTVSTTALHLGTNSVVRATVDSSGNVGIGTTAPTGTLQVHAAAGSQPTLKISDGDNNQPFTTLESDTSVCGTFTALSSTAGGLAILGYSDEGTVTSGLVLRGLVGSTDPADTVPGVNFRAGKLSGTTGTDMGAAETAFQFGGWDNTTRYLTILGNGNVGIGTTSPGAVFEIVAGGDNLRLSRSSFQSQQLGIGTANGINGLQFSDVTSGNTTISIAQSAPSASMVILSSGKVGHGIAAPTANLHSQVASGTGEVLNLSQTQSVNTQGAYISFLAGTAGTTARGFMGWAKNGSGPATVFTSEIADSLCIRATGNMHLGSNGDNITMTLDTSNNVGVGTISPTVRFHVRNGSSTYQQYIEQTGTGSDAYALTRYINADTSATVICGVGGTSVSNADLRNSASFGTQTAHSTKLFTSDAARLTIDSSGLVGIGSTSPAEILHVQRNGASTYATVTVRNTNSTATLNIGVGGSTVANAALQNNAFVLNAANSALLFGQNDTERMRITTAGNLKIAGTAVRGTTEGTNHIDLFDGASPAGTLTNGISIYSASGEFYVMDAAGNQTLLSPHDKRDNSWVYDSTDTTTGKRLKIDMEKMMKFLNNHFGTDFIHEYET